MMIVALTHVAHWGTRVYDERWACQHCHVRVVGRQLHVRFVVSSKVHVVVTNYGHSKRLRLA